MKVLMKGNEALAEAAIRAGCHHFFGYPITPQTELAAYMSKRMPKVGGTYLQAESEIAAINMVLGASAAGVRAMTSSSSPGISLKGEGISYMAGSDLPAVIINVQRGGPGLGGIQPSQADYWQATKATGHGDFQILVFAPSTVQEMADYAFTAFDVADRYRTPVMILADGMLGQMMEPVVMPEHLTEDADIVLVAYGASSRVARSAVNKAREKGIKAGLVRPITLWPFPTQALNRAASHAKNFLVVEMSMGQMVDDVKLAIDCKVPVHFYGRTGGMIPTPAEVLEQIEALL